NYAGGYEESAKQVVELERAGLDLAWVAEAYSFDAVTYMGYLAAKTSTVHIGSGILPIYSRTPTMLAQTAAGLDFVSDGRAILGLGTSGPQVIEGFHGVRFDRPIQRTREVVEICRRVWRREVTEYDGACYTLPLPPEQGTGLGKPLKLLAHPVRSSIPVYIASLGAKNVELTAEIADGWLPVFFSPARIGLYRAALEEGFARRAPGLAPPTAFDIAPTVVVICGPDVRACRAQVKPRLALYVGGMGARGRNFYNDLACRYGYEADARRIQDLYLAGKREDAIAAVPDALVDEIALCGPRERIRDRLAAYREAGVTTLICATGQPDTVRMMAELVL
ncbi:MAG TPA: LLM class F420-dependent oxidoreductase, partial [Methylomirabilota bacterium]|nr:LLM class F420-dependent oxidoreductase [Methylomirabilota bacterium]